MKISLLIIWYAACLIAGSVVFRVVTRVMLKAGHTRLNFLGRSIPTSLGVAYPLLTMLMLPAAVLLMGEISRYAAPMGIIVCGFGLLGLIDDLLQTREVGGFRGHIARAGALGEVSTALIKAFFGLSITLFAASLFWRDRGPALAVADSLIVALCANAVNLLDVRPGRAVKGFLAAALFILFGSVAGGILGGRAGILGITWFLFGPFAIWTFCYAATDFRCRGMMGDAGSNVLGAVLGLLVVWELSIPLRWVTLGLLIGFHLFCEVVSLTALIEKAPPLKWLDRLGVRPDETV